MDNLPTSERTISSAIGRHPTAWLAALATCAVLVVVGVRASAAPEHDHVGHEHGSYAAELIALQAAPPLRGPSVPSLAGHRHPAPGSIPSPQAVPIVFDSRYTSTNFVIVYATDFTTFPRHAATHRQAEILSAEFEEAFRVLITELGFRRPVPDFGGPLIDVFLFDHEEGIGGYAQPLGTSITMDPEFLRSSESTPSGGTPVHELFHLIQYEYNTDLSEGWVVEGLSSLVQDGVNTATDTDPLGNFVFRADTYLADARANLLILGISHTGLLDADYFAALFWKYFAERVGPTPNVEPTYRLDAIKQFYNLMAIGLATPGGRVGGTNLVEFMLQLYGVSSSFEEFYRDFLLTNYVKEYSYQSKYTYRDDDATPYRTVGKVATALAVGAEMTRPTESLTQWGARYYEGVPAADCQFVQVDATATLGGPPSFQIVAVAGTTVVDVYKTTGADARRTYYVGGGTAISRIAVIAGSEGLPRNYAVQMRCIAPALHVLTPSAQQYAYAGDAATPESFLATVEVVHAGGFVQGLDSSAFSVTIGGRAATVASSAAVQDQYWLVVLPPTQTTSTLYDLGVSLAGAPPVVSSQSVLYRVRPLFDQMLVLDSSGSMADQDKLGALRNAAALYIDLARPTDKVGVVTFSTQSRLLYPLAPANFLNKGLAKLSLDLMQPAGQTCIGCAAQTAQAELTASGGPTRTWNMVLMSDGMQNRAPLWDTVKPSVVDTKTVVDTLFLGPSDGDADALMQRIAQEGGGVFTRAFIDGEPGMSSLQTRDATPQLAPTLQIGQQNRLSNAYRTIRENTEGHQRFMQRPGRLSDGQPSRSELIAVEPGLDDLLVSVTWDVGTINATLRRADNSTVGNGDADVVEIATGARHKTWRVNLPASGFWHVDLSWTPGNAVEYLVVGTARSHTKLMAGVGVPGGSRTIGQPVQIVAMLMDTRPITGALVTATIQGPADLVDRRLLLWDDGRHGDGLAGDGVYANWYRPTRLAGGYGVDITAIGRNTSGQLFFRYKQLGFALDGAPDFDGDGIPNIWEIRNGLNPFGNDDAALDLDDDGLSNFEEYFYGTNPRENDSDGGGESDGAEVRAGRDPTDPADDWLRFVRNIRARPQTASVQIFFDPMQQYGSGGSPSNYILQRQLVGGPVAVMGRAAPSGWMTVENPIISRTVMTDTTAAPGATYQYRLITVDAQGNRSAPSAAVTVQVGPVRLLIPVGFR